MTLRLGVLFGAVLVLGAVNGAGAGEVCLIQADACTDIQGSKNANLVKILQNFGSAPNPTDQMTAKIIYSTFEDLQKKAKKSCKGETKVELEGFSPLFVLGTGSDKRALMVKGADTCAWIKVK